MNVTSQEREVAAVLMKKVRSLSIEFHIPLGCFIACTADKANACKEKNGAQHAVHYDLLNVMVI
jgi:hypothetical protein